MSPRHILYRAGEYDLDIAVEAAPGTSRPRAAWLRGQVLGQEPLSGIAAGGTARIEKRPSRSAVGRGKTRPSTSRGAAARKRVVATTPLDEQGTFAIGPLAPGPYTLTVEGRGVRLVVDRLDVK